MLDRIKVKYYNADLGGWRNKGISIRVRVSDYKDAEYTCPISFRRYKGLMADWKYFVLKFNGHYKGTLSLAHPQLIEAVKNDTAQEICDTDHGF